jgi:hypothetical protein
MTLQGNQTSKYSVLSGTGAGRVPGSSHVSAQRVPNLVSRLASRKGSWPRAVPRVDMIEFPQGKLLLIDD